MTVFDIIELAVKGAVIATVILFIIVGIAAVAGEFMDWLDGRRAPLDEQEALDNLRPLSHAVTRPPATDPVVALMREGMTADDAVREAFGRSTR